MPMIPNSDRKGGCYDGKTEMAMDQFKEWIKQFDVDKDGRISRDELKEAIRSTRAWFPGWKASRGVKAADVNGDGFIDDIYVDRKRVMTIDQFTEWMRGFSKNKDGQITRDELREAIRATRAWFSYWKAELGVKAADVN
ncbi:hypothetical protein RHSIM_Rhsim07G0229300 [Rhododendron simsii]|uniref:EF-hand domain-containing protein n=1 Tax=Rhododendron simsii TaxID=118357 RepID=A0A834LJM3_RHOSS|nr:hypothetical protein RHSIM_Rhsim07G0229300 [Rhododendron simsii]